MPHVTKQYNDFTCYLACLQNFFEDHGRTLDQLQVVKDNPELFAVGEWCEGSCDAKDFPEVAKRLNAELKWLPDGNFTPQPNVGFFFYTWWEGKEGDKHFVRFLEVDGDKLSVMNPSKAEIKSIPHEWVKAIAEVKLLPQVQQPEA